MKYSNFSVLMSVYRKENPDYLFECINSILSNTIVPDEIVIVKDGPLTIELDDVLKPYLNNSIFNIVGYDINRGLGEALNFGLSFCKNELVARMDSDDICSPTRFEMLLNEFNKNNNLDIVGSIVGEFIGNVDNVVSYRVVPENTNAIIQYAKKRNPFNHPSVMFKKSTVIKCGGYLDFYRHEDYYLWYRMIKNQCHFYNIQEPLLFMRISNDFYKRRGGYKTFCYRKKLNSIMKKDGFISFFNYIFVIFVNFCNFISPPFVRKIFHKKFLRAKY